MAAACGDQVPCPAVERHGEQDGLPAEAHERLAVAGVGLVEGQAADGGRLLGIDQDEAAREPVARIEGLIVEEAAGLVPAAPVSRARAVPPGGGKIQAGLLAVAGPPDEGR